MWAATTAVTLERRAAANARRSGQRVRTAIAVGHDPANAVHTSGNAHRANEISRRRARFPSMTSFPRRTTARRSANSAGRGGSKGDSANTSEASDNTSASITSDFDLPEIAPLNRAECRVPTKDRSQPARCNAT